MVVNVPEETARLVGGLTPVDQTTTEPPAVDPAAVTAWLDAEQAYQADVTAWLDAETAAAVPPAAGDQSTATGRGRK